VCQLGSVRYRHGVAIQEHLRARRQAGELPDTLLLLEHPPVYTRGRRSDAADLRFGEDFYRARGIDVVDSDRGGRLTFHGPGQLVGYPIMRITDIDRYLRTMEGAIVAALGEEGVRARSRHDEGVDYTGVWVADRKIASIGVHVSRGVTTHGFAINVANDLEPFSWVVACGLPEVGMTSLAQELARIPDGAPARTAGIACMRKRIAFQFARAHGRRQRLVTPARLGIDTTNSSGLAAERAPLNISPPPLEPILV
jgi:lipoyl(octanoyl) transferase